MRASDWVGRLVAPQVCWSLTKGCDGDDLAIDLMPTVSGQGVVILDVDT